MLPVLSVAPLHFWHALGTGLFVIGAAGIGMATLAYAFYWLFRFLAFVRDLIAEKTRLGPTDAGLVLFVILLGLPVAYFVGLEIVH